MREIVNKQESSAQNSRKLNITEPTWTHGNKPPRKDYEKYCAKCHGLEGKGDGEEVDRLESAPADLTQLSSNNNGTFPMERVVNIIKGIEKIKPHMRDDMPIWGDVFQVAEGGGEEEAVNKKITALAHYLWSIQAE